MSNDDKKSPVDSFFDLVDSAIDTLDKNLPPKYSDTDSEYIDAGEVKVTWGLSEGATPSSGWHLFDGVTNITLCGEDIPRLRARHFNLPTPGFYACCSLCLRRMQDAFEKQ
jgi:hypothetical protein